MTNKKEIIIKIMDTLNVSYETAESIFINESRSGNFEDYLASLGLSENKTEVHDA